VSSHGSQLISWLAIGSLGRSRAVEALNVVSPENRSPLGTCVVLPVLDRLCSWHVPGPRVTRRGRVGCHSAVRGGRDRRARGHLFERQGGPRHRLQPSRGSVLATAGPVDRSPVAHTLGCLPPLADCTGGVRQNRCTRSHLCEVARPTRRPASKSRLLQAVTARAAALSAKTFSHRPSARQRARGSPPPRQRPAQASRSVRRAGGDIATPGPARERRLRRSRD
jgi:hypothetical protein